MRCHNGWPERTCSSPPCQLHNLAGDDVALSDLRVEGRVAVGNKSRVPLGITIKDHTTKSNRKTARELFCPQFPHLYDVREIECRGICASRREVGRGNRR